MILSEFQNQVCAFSEQPGQKYESGSMLKTNIPAALQVRDCVLVRGKDKYYIEYINEYNYVTVWFIVGTNIEIVPHNQCCQVPIVDGTVSQSIRLHNISSDSNQFPTLIISSKKNASN